MKKVKCKLRYSVFNGTTGVVVNFEVNVENDTKDELRKKILGFYYSLQDFYDKGKQKVEGFGVAKDNKEEILLLTDMIGEYAVDIVDTTEVMKDGKWTQPIDPITPRAKLRKKEMDKRRAA